MGKQRRRRAKKGRAKVNPMGMAEMVPPDELSTVAPIVMNMKSTDPAARASACTAIGGIILNSKRPTALIHHLAKNGVVRNLISLLVDPNGHVAVAATRAVAKMAICGDNRVSIGLYKSDVMTPLLTLLTDESLHKALNSGLLSGLLTHALDLATCLAEQCDGVAKVLTEKGALKKALGWGFVEGDIPREVRLAAASLVCVASDDNPILTKYLLESEEGKGVTKRVLALCQRHSNGGSTTSKDSSADQKHRQHCHNSRRLSALAASFLLNCSTSSLQQKHTAQLAAMRKEMIEAVTKGLVGLVGIRPVAIIPGLSSKIHQLIQQAESRLSKKPAKGEDGGKDKAPAWRGHREVQPWEKALEGWVEEGIGLKVAMETFANLCSSFSSSSMEEKIGGAECETLLKAILAEIAKHELPKRLVVLLRDHLCASYAISKKGLAKIPKNSDKSKVDQIKEVLQGIRFFRQDLPAAQLMRVYKLLGSIALRCTQCLFNYIIHLSPENLGNMASLWSLTYEWLNVITESYADSDPDSLLSQQVESGVGLLWQLAMKRCIAPNTDLALLASLARSGKSPTTKAHSINALAQAGLHPTYTKQNLNIGKLILERIEEEKLPEPLEVLSAAGESLIDLYSEDNVFIKECRELRLVQRIKAFLPVYSSKLKGEEGQKLDRFTMEHQQSVLENLAAFADYKAGKI
eukprot:CAMPEP_0114502924 /NCGR_PEP_ID=MMETSP0109-20121206/9368_1 /TAXON_ID=29199 /ORGANISM="Chlorarachnion reptans, Strain CCCM449" /LENGTH=690 /DNA_ID=CAMNT_0001680907 /DNA_START=175 /DNA_END=2247 /DNA_ORIENTATION=-